DLFLTYNYINHLTLCKKELLDKIDGFRPEYNWSQDYDLYLRATEATDNIYHIPKVLYHWRMIPESSASKIDSRAEALAKSKQLLTETLQRRGINGFVTDGLQPGTFKIVTRRG
ncbi:MAG: glycosyltransferase family 2 protein, partial [bacterium]|nr:glycosyltransferase family 2 protein [bacterium]